jgi:hypothetical protein
MAVIVRHFRAEGKGDDDCRIAELPNCGIAELLNCWLALDVFQFRTSALPHFRNQKLNRTLMLK